MNEKKTEVSQKAELTQKIEESAQQNEPNDVYKQTERLSHQSKSHQIQRPLKSSNRTQSLLKRILRRKIMRINKFSQKILSNQSLKKVQMNINDSRCKIGTQAYLNESSEDVANKRISDIFFLNKKGLNKVSTHLNPRKPLIHHRLYILKLGVCKYK
ncbi:Hypothetical_protein [Hexamita inflata]|uniref:Hypothetical_protein n=1 Tax=Hexamita inflata TaxID=28002 RepID=A0AA86RXT5_9EUKA|nr:Hypothetical protein HINF_LOCUS62170 [Hexamita inflata]